MLIQEIAPLGVLTKKMVGMDYGEVIPLNDDDTNLVQYPTISVDVYYDNETVEDIKKILNINRQTILNETKDLKTRINQLTEDQTKVFNYVETNIETQKLIFGTGPEGVGKLKKTC